MFFNHKLTTRIKQIKSVIFQENLEGRTMPQVPPIVPKEKWECNEWFQDHLEGLVFVTSSLETQWTSYLVTDKKSKGWERR